MASSNGKVLETNDRAVAVPDQRSKAKRTSRIRWTVGLLVRLCIWYFLLTPFFRCPSHESDLTESSPRICKPYLTAKSYVEPHVAPYYNAHAAPYVDAARPYVRVLNEKVYTPASNIARQGYEAYGAPALDRAQVYGQQQWDANVVPHIQTAKAKANVWYEAQVAPHVRQVTAAVSPYYQKVYRAYWTTLDGYVLPFVATYRPFIGKTYASGQGILTTTVLPYAHSTWYHTVYFVNNSVWPKISNLYSENVEPQLVKIGQRLASYREGKRLRSATDEIESAAGYASPSSVSEDLSKTEATNTYSDPVAPTPSLSAAELAAQTRDKIASDLRTWKDRFASASEQGVEGLEARVVEVVATYLASGVQNYGEKLVTALQSAVEDQTNTIKRRINLLAESLPFEEAQEDEDAAVEELLKEIRTSAVSIRDRAHVLREWRLTFGNQLIDKVSVAVNSTLAVLDNVRDLGLQEIGMRWAWMDGVTYKDWEDYHALKAEFEDWKEKFREIGLKHARIEAAKEKADDILSRGMDVAEAAAKELARLKDVGKWKIAAREVSEDFDTRSEPPPPLPKPSTPVEEEIPIVADEEGAEAAVNENATEADSEASVQSDEVVKPEGSQGTLANDEISEASSVFSEDSATDSESDLETEELRDQIDFSVPQAAFGAAAAAVPVSNEADETDSLEHDEVVEAEATKLSEILSQSLGVEELNSTPIPTPSRYPTPNKAVEDLVSQLLADKDAAYAEEILKKLHAIYETTEPSAAPTANVVEDETVSIPVVDEQDNIYSILPIPVAEEAPKQPEIADPVPDSPVSEEDSEDLEPSALNPEPTQVAESNEDQTTPKDL
ncbi:hypothetical protein ASPCAL00480 [Aspergillus calidoustus]|uniref:Transcription factor hoxa13 n=1 Tax=Aspergillus calidoustus TaxID=454130 RepID=A0A0U5FSD4_ASPCI|nr:hypothetical protein ASPCAL00480 [Aspergillus calidoustus]